MRVLVCRPTADAAATARALAAAGHEAVLAPVMAIDPLPVAAVPGGTRATIATSRHAFAALPAGVLARLVTDPLFAVGRATAAAARALGFPDVRTGGGDAASLPALVRLTLAPPAPLLYLAGRMRRDELARSLRGMGYALEIVETYEARPTGPWPGDIADALKARRIEAVLHYSARSATLALDAAAAVDALPPFRALLHACLSAAVAQPLHEAGAERIAVAAAPDEASLLQALRSPLR